MTPSNGQKSEVESPSRFGKPLRCWTKRLKRSNGEALLRKLAEEAKTPIDAFEHLRRRLTGEVAEGNISKRVIAQLERSERAYKGWETRKENSDGRPEAEARPEG